MTGSAIAGAAMLGGTLGLVATLAIARPALPDWLDFGSRCTVGAVGTAASLTVEGPRATEGCRIAIDAQPTRLYLASRESDLPVVCEYRLEGRLLRVRDQGALKLFGTQWCANLRAYGAAPR